MGDLEDCRNVNQWLWAIIIVFVLLMLYYYCPSPYAGSSREGYLLAPVDPPGLKREHFEAINDLGDPDNTGLYDMMTPVRTRGKQNEFEASKSLWLSDPTRSKDFGDGLSGQEKFLGNAPAFNYHSHVDTQKSRFHVLSDHTGGVKFADECL